MNKREDFFINLFNSLLFGTVFTFAGPLVSGQPIDWGGLPLQLAVGIGVGMLVGMIIPAGKWGAILAGKAAKPGSLLFRFIMYSVILVIMLTFMCPILTVFIACVMGGAPVAAVLPTCYAMFVPFYVIGILMLMLAMNRDQLALAQTLVEKIEFLELASQPSFQRTFAKNMTFREN